MRYVDCWSLAGKLRLLHTSAKQAIYELALEPGTLVVRAAPLDLPALEMQMVWYPGHERDPTHVWFRGLLQHAARASGLRPL